MAYNVKFLDSFLDELDDICKRCSEELKLDNLSKQLRKDIKSFAVLLENTPRMFVQINKFNKEKRKYRKFVINNYVILYTIDEKNKTVYIAHICYGKTNYINNLF